MTIDLQRFCAKSDDIRSYLCAPWKNKNGRVMASNGHIAILLDPGVNADGLALGNERISNRILEWETDIPSTGFVAADWTFPADPACDHCDGLPAEPDEDGEIDECYWCEGTGFNKKLAFKIGTARFATHYLRLVASLPDCRIAPRGSSRSAVFKFDGGVGFLMPIRD